MREVTTDSRFASRCWLVVFENRIKKVIKNVKKTLPGDQSFLSGIAFSVRVACHSRSWLNELSLKCHLSLSLALISKKSCELLVNEKT